MLYFRTVLWVAIMVSSGFFGRADEGLKRQRNLTLAIPQKPAPAETRIVEAFPGLTFLRPVAIVSPPGETNRVFVVEKGGQIIVVTNLAFPTKTLFLDLGSKVDEQFYNENGLLGLAFHPGFSAGDPLGSNYFYVFYTGQVLTESGNSFYDRLARFEVDPTNPNRGLPDSELPLFTQIDESSSHNGGDLHFGDDGYLFISTGDEGGLEGTFGNSRLINQDFFGAILRIDVDKRPSNPEPNWHPAVHTNAMGMAFYSIPADNPFVGATRFNGQIIDSSTVRTEFWAVGFRNPWRFSLDPLTQEMYCGDVGVYRREEIDLVVRGGDYGWNYMEGIWSFSPIPPGTIEVFDLSLPIVDYVHSDGWDIAGGRAEGSAVVGGVVYRGTRFPELYGDYIFGDFVSGRIFAFRQTNGVVTNFRQIGSTLSPSAFGYDPSNGDVLIARYEDFGGSIQRVILGEPGGSGSSIPPILGETGAFRDLVTLEPETGVERYDINVPFWSDHAIKTRWFSIPDTNQTMAFSAEGNWQFPTGAVWIKHFELELTNGVPESRRRLETRFLVKNSEGVHGFTYRWNASQTDAELVGASGQDEVIAVYQADGSLLRNQAWRYPGRSECLQCHTPHGGYALGFNTHQMNRDHSYADGITNQIGRLSAMGYFDAPTPDVGTLGRLAAPNDATASMEHRVRSYLQANCVQCHQPGGVARGVWDARITTPMAEAGILNGILVSNDGDADNRVIRPGSLEHSVLFQRVGVLGERHMPPLGTTVLNEEAITLLKEWIEGVSGILTVRWSLETVEIVYHGEPGRGYRIEHSDDLIRWETIATVTASAAGEVRFNDERRPEAKTLFYRVAWP